jgi:hypothetical protein
MWTSYAMPQSLAERVAALEAQAQLLQHKLERTEAALEDLQTTTVISKLEQYVRVEELKINDLTGPHIIIEGANFHVRNGLGQDRTNGLGNLIIGYNQKPLQGYWPIDSRSGSNNLVVGDWNMYTSHGGLVAGHANSVSAPNSSVLGGSNNKTSGYTSVVLGGYRNDASGTASVVSGGENNEAAGQYSVVSGGSANVAEGLNSSVNGGGANYAVGEHSTVVGGTQNMAHDLYEVSVALPGSLIKGWARVRGDGEVRDCYKCNRATTRRISEGHYTVDFSPLSNNILTFGRVVTLYTTGEAYADKALVTHVQGDYTKIHILTYNSNNNFADCDGFYILVF